MKKTSSLTTYLCALAVSALAAFNGAHGASVSIANHSFEAPDLSTGDTWTNTYPDWSATTDGGGGSFVELIGGFSSDGAQHIGLGDAGYQVWQDLNGVSLMPNTVYTLTVAIGNRNADFTGAGNQSIISLYANGFTDQLATASMDAFNLEVGTFEDFSLTYTTDDNPIAGDLRIVLENGTVLRSHFDNVRLDATVIPEPSSLGLLIFGGLLFLRRRRG